MFFETAYMTCLGTIEFCPGSPVTSMAFSPNGVALLVTGMDQRVGVIPVPRRQTREPGMRCGRSDRP